MHWECRSHQGHNHIQYKVNFNITDSNGPLVLPPLPSGYTFVVTSILMQMLTTRGLFVVLMSQDPHVHIAKLRVVCKSCVGRSDWDMDVIGLWVFPLSLTIYAAVLFNKLHYNSIYTCEKLTDAFLSKLFPVFKKLNQKDKPNNFVTLPAEFVSSS